MPGLQSNQDSNFFGLMILILKYTKRQYSEINLTGIALNRIQQNNSMKRNFWHYHFDLTIKKEMKFWCKWEKNKSKRCSPYSELFLLQKKGYGPALLKGLIYSKFFYFTLEAHLVTYLS